VAAPQSIQIISPTADTTAALGREIGRHIHAGAVIALTGDLASGKSVLVRGLARGLGVPESVAVTSPSYALIHDYPGRVTLYHADLYRLESGYDTEEIGLLDLFDREAVVAVEWADRMDRRDLPGHLNIQIRVNPDGGRVITLTDLGLMDAHIMNHIDTWVKERSWG